MAELNQAADERARNEARFHDARIQTPDEKRLGFAYTSVQDVLGFTAVPSSEWDRSVLEIGCFRGDAPRSMDGFSGNYVGIDISPAAIEECQALGLPSNFQFRVDDGNHLGTVADASVDYAFGQGVLHHLDLERCAPALARVLAPGGYARFVEPAQGNILLRMFRRLTPKLRTPDEHPFDDASIETLGRHFDVRITHQALTRPFLPIALLNARWAIDTSRWLDDRLLRNEKLQPQAWLLQVELRKRVPT